MFFYKIGLVNVYKFGNMTSFVKSKSEVKSLFSTAYFPPISYFLYLGMGESHQLEQFENYIKQSYRNRAIIYGANGPMSLTVPVVKKSNSKTLVSEILIGYDEDWQAQHWKSICSAYLSSPFFEYYKDDLFVFFSKRYEKLFDLNFDILMYFLDVLDFKTNLVRTSEFVKDVEGFVDRRNSIHPKKVDPIVEKQLAYWQVFSDQYGFQSNLSILDLLCNEGPNAENYLKKCLKEIKL